MWSIGLSRSDEGYVEQLARIDDLLNTLENIICPRDNWGKLSFTEYLKLKDNMLGNHGWM